MAVMTSMLAKIVRLGSGPWRNPSHLSPNSSPSPMTWNNNDHEHRLQQLVAEHVIRGAI
jgi:hypothetical protein